MDCPNDRYLNDEKIRQAAVAMLARIGIDVTLEGTPKNIHFTKVDDKNTDMFLTGWGVSTLGSQYPMEYLLDVDSRANAAECLEKIHYVWQIAQADAPYALVHVERASGEFRHFVSVEIAGD